MIEFEAHCSLEDTLVQRLDLNDAWLHYLKCVADIVLNKEGHS